MKAFWIILAAATLAARGVSAADAPDKLKPLAELPDASIEARRAALDLAGAFSNDGFKIRDGHWIGEVKKGTPAVILVNLYAGNQYWFSAAAASGEGSLAVALLDENGEPTEFEPFAEGSRGAAGFSPEISGPYLLKVEWQGAIPAPVCVVYSYK